MSFRVTFRRLVAVGLVMIAGAGCASMDGRGTVIAINPGDVPQLSGPWQGTFTAPSGRVLPASLMLNADGTYVSRAEAYSTRGVTRVKDSKLVLEPDTSGGAPAVHASEATLVMMPDGMAILSGIGTSPQGAFSYELRRTGR